MTGALRLATGRFARGYNCAQAVFSAFSSRFGISSEVALRIAAPFGGGIARQGEVCGALTGALMALGLQYSGNRPEGKEEMYRLANEFIDSFRQNHGAILCRDLVGHDISTADGLRAAREANVFANVCPLLVDDTVRLLATYIREHPVH